MKYIIADPIFWLSILLLILFVNNKFYKKIIINYILYFIFYIFIFISIPVIANNLVSFQEAHVPLDHNSLCKFSDADNSILIVLSGGLNDISINYPLSRLQLASYTRAISAFELYKQRSDSINKIVIAGGIGHEFKEAEIIKNLYVNLGIDKNKILIDTTSNNTHQNAVNVSELITNRLNRDNLILVTSALHMKRAVYAFNSVGLNVCAFPVSSIFVTNSIWLPRLSALIKSKEVIQEILAYWIYLLIY